MAADHWCLSLSTKMLRIHARTRAAFFFPLFMKFGGPPKVRWGGGILTPKTLPPPPDLPPAHRGGSRGGSWGSGLPPPPFWGTPKLHKEGKMARACARKLCVLVLNSYLDPPPLSEILYPPLCATFNQAVSKLVVQPPPPPPHLHPFSMAKPPPTPPPPYFLGVQLDLPTPPPPSIL